jgi:hypothetical protein
MQQQREYLPIFSVKVELMQVIQVRIDFPVCEFPFHRSTFIHLTTPHGHFIRSILI